MPKVTLRQLEVLRVIRDYAQEHSMAPTHREIQQSLGVSSTNTVVCLLEALESRGYLIIRRNTHRGLRLSEQGTALLAPATEEKPHE